MKNKENNNKELKENKTLKVFSFNEDGSVCECEIPNKDLYLLSFDVGDTKIGENHIQAMSAIEAGQMIQSGDGYLVMDLVNGKKYTKVVQETDHSIPYAPKWSKMYMCFLSYDRHRLENMSKQFKYYVEHCIKSTYDCLNFEDE